MTTLEKKVNAMARMLVTEDAEAHNAAREELRELVRCEAEGCTAPPDATPEICKILTELGMPEHIKGHGYSIEAISLAVADKEVLFKITTRLYPEVAKKFGTTPSRVERAIRHGIELVWDRCDLKTLYAYFGNSVSSTKGKLTNSEFIARVANIVRQQMKDAA